MSLTSDLEGKLSGVSNLYVGDLPTTPDNVVGIFLSGGYPRDLTGNYVGEPTFQIRVRNTSYSTGETLCDTIKDALHGVHNSGNFLLIQQQGDTLDLGRDANDRHEWSINFRCLYK